MSEQTDGPRFATVDEDELKRILTEKDAKNTIRATNGAVKVFRAYLKARDLPEDFENYEIPQLDEALGKFFVEVRQENGDKYQKSSLYGLRYGLNRHLSLSKNFDITKDQTFQVSRKIFQAVTKDLKKEGKEAVNHYPPIEQSDLIKMYEYFDTSDRIKLQQKVFVDVMLYFGRRGRENIHDLKINDFAATTDADGKLYVYICTDEQTKNHQNDANSAEGRMYARKDDPGCPVKSFMKYKRQLNPKCIRFFQRPSKAADSLTWYVNAPLGHNSIGDMMPTISSSAGLSKRYTNHSLRSTTVHILDANEFAGRHITSITGHKSETSLKTYTGYTAPSIKRKMSDTISDTLRNKLKKVATKSVTITSSQEVDIELSNNSQLVPLSNSQYDNLMSDLQDDPVFDGLLEQLPENHDNQSDQTKDNSTSVSEVQKENIPNNLCGIPNNFPMPVFHGCSNITVNFNFKN